jgi:hypothetical protein
MRHMRHWLTSAAVFAVVLASAQPVAAQPANPDACSAAIELAYLKSDGVDKDQPPSQAFIDLAMQQPLIQIFCGTAGATPAGLGTPNDSPDGPSNPADGSPNPARTEPPSDAPPTAGVPSAATDDGPDNRVDTDRSACLLVTVSEVGAAMKQSVTANPADPFGVAGAQGCEFNNDGPASTSIIYFQANGADVYESFQHTAEANGVQGVSGLGDRAFSFVGNNGPGLVVAKGDKLFAMQFSGLGSGSPEKNSLLVLAQQAVGRVH